MASALIGGVATVGKELWVYIYPKISNIIKFNTNLQRLRKEKDKLMNIVRTVKEQTAAAERGGHVLAPEVLNWLKDFEKNQTKLDLLESKIDGAEIKCYKTCCSRCILGSDVAKQLIKVKRLVDGGSFPTVVVENFSVKKVEHVPGPTIVHQSTASKNLMKVLDMVNDERVNIIGVWGMGGVGKTTLVKNINNLFEIPNSDGKFSIIMWATASKDADIRSIQSQLLKRLNLKEENGENKERTAGRLHQRLTQEKRILFILDDVWEEIDLDYLGFSGIIDNGNKIILTTRSMDVCRQMKTDVEVRVDVLNEDESWQLFIKNAGSDASLEHIEPIAKQINLECSGLPLAIIVVSASMRRKKTIGLWEDALQALKKSVPYVKGIEDKVYRPLMWSYDSLYFHNMNVKSCFLYCCLYPEDSSIRVNELVLCWIGEGLIDDSDSYEDMVNTGVSMVEYLKDTCLLEKGIYRHSVKMHDVVRDVATWIATSLNDDCKSFVCSGFTIRSFSEEVLQENYRRVSLIDTSIGQLPNCSKQHPQVLSLLLQGKSLPDIPEEFFLGLPGLRVLNLSYTSTHSIPGFICQLSELRTLLVQRFTSHYLPPVGDLRMLQVLDCSYSYLRTFPEGMEKLTNLRSLILLDTRLHHIEEGVISKLTSLEILDMTGSPYKWVADAEKRTPFDELQCLNRLTFLSISFVMPSSSTADFSWLTRVNRFKLIVDEDRDFPQLRPRQHEKTVRFFRFEIGGIGFKSLLQTAICASFLNCSKLERLWVDLDMGYQYKALKSLRISDSGWIFQPVTGVSSEIDLLPNLEELILHDMSSIESISQLMHCFGMRFSKLRTIEVSLCDNLTCLFTSSNLIPTSEILEVITVRSCNEFLGFYQNVATTNLKPKSITLEYLPKFSTLFGEQESWKKLEKLEVFNCDRIKKLPFDSLSASNIKEISGTQEWWNLLEWDDQVSKLSLQRYFIPSEDISLDRDISFALYEYESIEHILEDTWQ